MDFTTLKNNAIAKLKKDTKDYSLDALIEEVSKIPNQIDFDGNIYYLYSFEFGYQVSDYSWAEYYTEKDDEIRCITVRLEK